MNKYANVRHASYAVHGDTFTEAIQNTSEYTHEQLVALVVNSRLNEFVSHWADKDDDREKLVPYVGWFWRSTDFVNGNIPIGNCGDFIGVMESNKWGYPERDLTPDEATQVTDIVWAAYLESQKGGILADIHKAIKGELGRLWDLFQTFRIEVTS